jgi:hypothetical protein
MTNDFEAQREIQSLSLNARNYLSHILRNGLCIIMAHNGKNKDCSEAIMELEKKIREMGL